MRALETRIPPPVVMLLLGVFAWAASSQLPALSFHLPFSSLLAVALVAVGVALNLLPKLAFGRARTTINPLKPQTTTHLVTSGIFRYTRNPMYLGQSVIVLAWAVYLHNVVALLAVPAFMLYITRFQILPEERHLGALFGDGFEAFCRWTRRWV